MSSTLFPFIAKVNAPRALFTPQIRYGTPPPQAKGLCAAVVRAGRGEQNPLLYNLAAGHYSDGGLPVTIKEFEPYAPFEPYESRVLHEGQDELLSEEKEESQVVAQSLPPATQATEDPLDFDIDSILEGVRNGTICNVSPQAAPALVYFNPANQSSKEQSSTELAPNESFVADSSAQVKENTNTSTVQAPQEPVAPNKDSKSHGVTAHKKGTSMGSKLSSMRLLSGLSPEYRSLLTISHNEFIQGNEHVRNEIKPLVQRAQIIAKNLIAYAGMQTLSAHLNATREDYLQQSNNGAKGIGLVIFDHLEPMYIDLICTRLYLHQQSNFNNMLKSLGEEELSTETNNSAIPSPFRTEQDNGLGRDFKRVNTFVKWINEVGEDSYDPFDTVHMAIPRHTIKDLDKANSNFYVDRINRAIHWRDHNNDTGQIVLSGVNSDDIQSSMEGVPSIKNDDLINSMLDNLNVFFSENYETYKLKNYDVKGTKDALKTTLTLLHNNSDFSFSLFDLASYAALCWMYYSEVDDMPQALGMAMPIINLPREDNLFKNPSAKTVTEKRYSNIIANKAAFSLCYRSGYDLSGESLKIKTLIKNLYYNFNWPEKDNNIVFKDEDSEENPRKLDVKNLIDLTSYEICTLKNFLLAVHRDSDQERFDRAYNTLCFIEWQNKLQKLFIESNNSKSESKSLSERTREHIEQEVKNGVEPLSDEENEILPLCDKPSSLRSVQDLSSLIAFYTNRQFVIQISPSLNKDWEKILFAQESYEHENFLLALTQALLYVMKSSDHKGYITHVVLDLPLSFNEVTKINSNVFRCFSIYFGHDLQELCERSNNFIKLSFNSEIIDLQKTKDKDGPYNPITNYIAYHKSNTLKNCSATSKAATTIKFTLTPYYFNGAKGESLQLYWSLSNDHFGYNLFKDVRHCGESKALQYSTYDRTIEVQSSSIPMLDLSNNGSFSFVHNNRNYAVFAKEPSDIHNLSKLLDLVALQANKDLEYALNKLQDKIDNLNGQEPKEHEIGIFDNSLELNSTLQELKECASCLEQVIGDINSLKNEYFACLYKLLECSLSYQDTSSLSNNYSRLQHRLMSAPLSTNKITNRYAKKLLELLVMIGMSYEGEVLSNDLCRYLDNSFVTDRDSSVPIQYQTALATPLCIDSLHSLAMKNERLIALMCSIIQGKMKLNNQNLFIDHLTSDINYADNCEHNVRFNRNTNRYDSLLSYQNSLGYTLYQSARAYQERFNSSKYSALGKNWQEQHSKGNKLGSSLLSSSNYNTLISRYQQDYLNEVGDYIEQYLKSRPYLMEQCTIMIYYCGVVDLIVAIYRYLEQNRNLSKVKFNLIIVNCTLDESKLIYQVFEQEKALRSKGNIDGSFIQRIVVNILTTDQAVSPNAGSHFNFFLNKEKLSFNEDEDQSLLSKMMAGEHNNSNLPYANFNELSRIADICLMFHVFDAHAKCKFSHKNVSVPIVLNDIEYQPSIINCSNYQEILTADSNLTDTRTLANNLGKYLVCPVLTVNRAQMQHTLYYLVKEDLALFNSERSSLARLINTKLLGLKHDKQDSNQDDQEHLLNHIYSSLTKEHLQNKGYKVRELDSLVPLVGVPLFELSLNEKANNFQDSVSSIIQQVHKRSDVVVYFDDLMGRLMLEQNNIDVVYYHKLRNFALNFMVASNSGEQHSKYYIKELLKLFKYKVDLDEACQKIRNDAIAISGSLLLRAETKRIHAYEMMGLVLSQYLGNDIFNYLGTNMDAKPLLNKPTYVSLDDYCAIFGKKNQLRADILGLQLYERSLLNSTSNESSKGLNKRYVLSMVVLESKFFEKPNEKAANKSLTQTQSSTQNFYNVLHQAQDALGDERKLWLSRIADMLLTNADLAQHLHNQVDNKGALLKISANEFVKVQELLRNGEIDIVLKGISLVYAHSHEDMTYSKTKALHSGRVLGPGAHSEFVQSQLSRSKDKYSVIQIKVYQDALSHLIQLYLNEDKHDALSYLIKHDSENLIKTYLERIETLSIDMRSKYAQMIDYSHKDYEAMVSDDIPVPSLVETNEKLAEPLIEPIDDINDTDNSLIPPESDITDNEPVSESHDKDKIIESSSDNLPDSGDEFAVPLDSKLSTQIETVQESVELVNDSIVASSNGDDMGNVNTAQVDRTQDTGGTKLNAEMLSELDSFFNEHQNVHELVKNAKEMIDFSNPKTLSFIQEAETSLIQGLVNQGLKPILKDTKVTANGAIFSFEGNDHFETAMISRVKSKLLTTYGVDIYDIRPKSRQIDLYVKTPDRISIPYFSLLTQREFNYDYYDANGLKKKGYNTKLILGLGEESGEIVYLDYRQESPHTLVAGTTGSGKSVLLNCLILDMALTNWPEELELILVDPKRGVEFGPFETLPHLHNRGIIIEKDDAIAQLNDLVEVMEKRADEFTALTAQIQSSNQRKFANIRDIDAYNLQCTAFGKERMRHIVFIMDEFADWFIDKEFKDNATSCLQRLAQKGRFSGINVIFATQRPDSKLMDSNVKAQLGNRIALKTTDKTNSKIILDDNKLDASQLNGKGHMICKLSNVDYAQSGYISNSLVDSVVQAIIMDYEQHLKNIKNSTESTEHLIEI